MKYRVIFKEYSEYCDRSGFDYYVKRGWFIQKQGAIAKFFGIWRNATNYVFKTCAAATAYAEQLDTVVQINPGIKIPPRKV